VILGLDFPPVSHLVEWPNFIGEGPLAINKVVLVYFLAAACTMLIFVLGNKKQPVPTGAQNFAEISVEFVENQIVMPTMGTRGLRWTPYIAALFFFIFFCNIFEVVPGIQMPATGRIALPMFLGLLTYILYNGAGIKEHGPFGYLRHTLIPAGTPKALLPLVIPIELLSTFIIRPFSHIVRLFANLLAGHILLVTFTVLSAALWAANPGIVLLPLPVLGVIFFVAFEILVSFLQAYVFALLTGVYVNLSVSHEH
jgi:F-type H+-transporting ATPase subunit a